MRVLLAPDGFDPDLTPREAAAAMAAGWRTGAPHDEVTAAPLTNGGAGFVDTLHASLGGRLLPVVARGPWGEPAPATILLVGDVAYVESAHVVGPALVPAGRGDPARTSSSGVADLLREARAAGARRIVVGLGGSAAADAGMGMLAALGLPERLAAGGGRLDEATADDLAGLPELRAAWSGIELVAAADVDAPLLGLSGASAGLAPRQGATPDQAQRLERALSHVARLAAAVLGERPNLLAEPVPFGHLRGAHVSTAPGAGSAGERLAAVPGAGAAGGLGFGLALLGARLTPGATAVADALGLDALLAAGDVVVTGEGRLDWHSLHGTVVAEVAQRALAFGVPTVVVAGEVLVGRREQAAAGISAAYAVLPAPEPDPPVAGAPRLAGALERRTAAVARTWSPPPSPAPR